MSASLGLQHLILLGAGPSHLRLLQALADSRPAHLRLTLVAPRGHTLPAALVTDRVCGALPPGTGETDLAAAVARCGGRLITAPVVALHADTRQVQLAGGDTLSADWLSLDLAPDWPRATLETALPGACEHALPLWPADSFARLWPRVLALAATRVLRVTVVGSGLTAVELALAIDDALAQPPAMAGARVTLVAGGAHLAPGLPPPLLARLQRALRRRGITVLPETCTGFGPGEVQLAGGGRLLSDVPVLAAEPPPPAWLADAGLAQDEQGRLRVDERLRSTSHPAVHACGVGVASPLAPTWPVLGAAEGLQLVASLRAAVQGDAGPVLRPRRPGPLLVADGARHALGQWGRLGFEGGWVARWRAARLRSLTALTGTPVLPTAATASGAPGPAPEPAPAPTRQMPSPARAAPAAHPGGEPPPDAR